MNKAAYHRRIRIAATPLTVMLFVLGSLGSGLFVGFAAGYYFWQRSLELFMLPFIVGSFFGSLAAFSVMFIARDTWVESVQYHLRYNLINQSLLQLAMLDETATRLPVLRMNVVGRIDRKSQSVELAVRLRRLALHYFSCCRSCRLHPLAWKSAGVLVLLCTLAVAAFIIQVISFYYFGSNSDLVYIRSLCSAVWIVLTSLVFLLLTSTLEVAANIVSAELQQSNAGAGNVPHHH